MLNVILSHTLIAVGGTLLPVIGQHFRNDSPYLSGAQSPFSILLYFLLHVRCDGSVMKPMVFLFKELTWQTRLSAGMPSMSMCIHSPIFWKVCFHLLSITTFKFVSTNKCVPIWWRQNMALSRQKGIPTGDMLLVII